jgi:hypothetical protein
MDFIASPWLPHRRKRLSARWMIGFPSPSSPQKYWPTLIAPVVPGQDPVNSDTWLGSVIDGIRARPSGR